MDQPNTSPAAEGAEAAEGAGEHPGRITGRGVILAVAFAAFAAYVAADFATGGKLTAAAAGALAALRGRAGGPDG